MSQSLALLLLGASGLLVWAGIRNQSPVKAVQQVLSGGAAAGPTAGYGPNQGHGPSGTTGGAAPNAPGAGQAGAPTSVGTIGGKLHI